MLINLSNHPSKNWSARQKEAALSKYAKIYDLPFPDIDPNDTEKQISEMAFTYLDKIQKIIANIDCQDSAVHIQGEFTFVFKLVTLLKSSNINCLASTSQRKVQELEGKKIVEFNFVKFRSY